MVSGPPENSSLDEVKSFVVQNPAKLALNLRNRISATLPALALISLVPISNNPGIPGTTSQQLLLATPVTFAPVANSANIELPVKGDTYRQPDNSQDDSLRDSLEGDPAMIQKEMAVIIKSEAGNDPNAGLINEAGHFDPGWNERQYEYEESQNQQDYEEGNYQYEYGQYKYETNEAIDNNVEVKIIPDTPSSN